MRGGMLVGLLLCHAEDWGWGLGLRTTCWGYISLLVIEPRSVGLEFNMTDIATEDQVKPAIMWKKRQRRT